MESVKKNLEQMVQSRSLDLTIWNIVINHKTNIRNEVLSGV